MAARVVVRDWRMRVRPAGSIRRAERADQLAWHVAYLACILPGFDSEEPRLGCRSIERDPRRGCSRSADRHPDPPPRALRLLPRAAAPGLRCRDRDRQPAPPPGGARLAGVPPAPVRA